MTNETNVWMPEVLANIGTNIQNSWEGIITNPNVTSFTNSIPEAIKHPIEAWKDLTEKRKRQIKNTLLGVVALVVGGKIATTAYDAFKPKDPVKDDQVQVNYNSSGDSSLTYHGGSSLEDSEAVVINMDAGETINLPILEGEYEPGSKCDNYRIALVYLSEGDWFRAAQAANRNVVNAPAHSGDEERIIRFAMENDNDGDDADPNLDILGNVEEFYQTRAGEIWGDDISQHCE